MIAAISALCLAAAAHPARAQSAEAESLFSEGDRLMKSGKLDEACDSFEASNRIEARAGTLIRLGECREQNHQLASAWSAYKDALTRVKDPRKKSFASGRISAIEPRLSYLTVAVVDDSRLDKLTLTRNDQPLDPVLWNRAVPVNGGDYVIVGHAPGHEDWRTTITVPADSGKVTVDVPRLKEIARPVATAAPRTAPAAAARPPTSAPATTAAPTTAPTPQRTASATPPRAPDTTAAPRAPNPAPAPPPRTAASQASPASPAASSGAMSAASAQPETDSSSIWSGKRKAAIGFVVGTAAAIAIAVVFSGQANDKHDQAHQLCASPTSPCADADKANQLISDGHGLALDANIALGAAAALAITGGVLWFTGAPESSHGVAVAPRVGNGETGLVVVGHF